MDVYAGYIAAPDLKAEIDTNGDGQFTQAELDGWLAADWARQVGIEIDSLVNLMTQATLSVSYDGSADEMFITAPVAIVAIVPAPQDGTEHTLLIRNRYQSYRSDYQVELFASKATDAELTANRGEVVTIRFTTDPTATSGDLVRLDASAVGLAGASRLLRGRLGDALLWIVIGVAIAGVAGWLVVLRLRERAQSRSRSLPKQSGRRPAAIAKANQSAKMVRQSQATKKKTVAVRTIDAPEE